jgi:PAS domain S-box-containing protein
MKFKFGRRLQIGYGFLILMILAVGIISYATLQNLLKTNEAVEHSNKVIEKLEKAISTLKDAETGQRGYLLTDNDAFLQPYKGAVLTAGRLVSEVGVLTRDNAVQQSNVASIKNILDHRAGILQTMIERKMSGRQVLPTDLLDGKEAIDALRKAVDKAEKAERRLLWQRTGRLRTYSAYAPVAIVAAVTLALLSAVISYVRLIRDIREKERLRTELVDKEQETAAFNEELTAANKELRATNEELFDAQQALGELNTSLDRRVTERTAALAESEEETQALNEELTAINEELASANEEMVATNEELQRNRMELERSENLFRSIAVNIPKSLVIVMAPDHRFVLVEGELMQQMGYKGQDYAGKHPLEVGPAERYEMNRPLYDRVMAGEQFRTERKGVNGADYQVDFVPLRNDAQDVYAALIIALDISEIKQAEERSAKLAAIVESSDDAIIGKNLDGTITSWNKSAERIFGYLAEEMVGESILKLLPEDRLDEEPRIISRLRAGDRVDHFETKRMTSDGRQLDVSLTISPIKDKQGLVTGVSKIVRDISEKKEDELRKNDFIGMVSHELKTPLTSLKALIQVLDQKLKASDDQFVSSALGKANIQVGKMTSMINGFLNVSRLESGKIHIEKQEFNLADVLSEAVAEAELVTSTHQLMVVPCEPVTILADREKIGSVISNLISNAVKYSPRAKLVTITCGMENNEVKLSVSDQGMGIKPHDLDRLFERYYRVSSPHTKTISGFGIGLYLCAEIIHRHNGKIWVESKIGEGSTFVFTLPLR